MRTRPRESVAVARGVKARFWASWDFLTVVRNNHVRLASDRRCVYFLQTGTHIHTEAADCPGPGLELNGRRRSRETPVGSHIISPLAPHATLHRTQSNRAYRVCCCTPPSTQSLATSVMMCDAPPPSIDRASTSKIKPRAVSPIMYTPRAGGKKNR